MCVTIASGEAWIIARAEGMYGLMPRHTVPMPEDLGRIEKDFGVHAWRIVGVAPVAPPSVGQALMAKAVDGMN